MTKSKLNIRVWERQPGESDRAYAAFLAYRDLYPRRSLERLAEVADDPESEGAQTWSGSVSLSALRKLCQRWDWVERCRRWDNHRQKQRDREAAKRTAEVERRKVEWLERAYNNAVMLDERARRLAKFPVVEQTHEKRGSKEVTIIRPGRLIGREIGYLMSKANELALAYFAAHEKDVAQMSEEEMVAITEMDYPPV